jgi:hypothetical protein
MWGSGVGGEIIITIKYRKGKRDLERSKESYRGLTSVVRWGGTDV